MLLAHVLVALLALASLHSAGAARIMRIIHAQAAPNLGRKAGSDVSHGANQDAGQESLTPAGAGDGGNGSALARGDVGGELCGYNPGQPQVGLVDPANGQLFRFELNRLGEPLAAVLEERHTPLHYGHYLRHVVPCKSQCRMLQLRAPSGFASALEVEVAGAAGAPSVWSVYRSRKWNGVLTRHSWHVADCEGNVVFTINQQHGEDEVWKVYLGSKRDGRHLYWARQSDGSTHSYLDHFDFTFYTHPEHKSEEHKVARLFQRRGLEYTVFVSRPDEDAGIILIASALMVRILAELHSAGAARGIHAQAAPDLGRKAGSDGSHGANQDAGQKSLTPAGAGDGGKGSAPARGDVGGDSCGYNQGLPRVGLVDPANGQLFGFELNRLREPFAAVLKELRTPLAYGHYSKQIVPVESQSRMLQLGTPSGFASTFSVQVAGAVGASSVWSVYRSKTSGILARRTWRVADCEGNVVFTIDQQHGGDWKVYLGSRRHGHGLYWARQSDGLPHSYVDHFDFTFYTHPKPTSEGHNVARLKRHGLEYTVLVRRPDEDAGIILIASALMVRVLLASDA